MTTPELLQFHESFCGEARALMQKKNHDYAGADGDTPFANFEASEKLRVCSTEAGMLVRMLDKFMRLSTFLNAGKLMVAGEGAHDSLQDIVNYSILLAARLEEKAVIPPLKT